MFYRLGELVTITGFDVRILLKMRDAGSLKPRQIPGYQWDCYPREQVVALCDPQGK